MLTREAISSANGYLVFELVLSMPDAPLAAGSCTLKGPLPAQGQKDLQEVCPSLARRLQDPAPRALYLVVRAEAAGRWYDRTVVVHDVVEGPRAGAGGSSQ